MRYDREQEGAVIDKSNFQQVTGYSIYQLLKKKVDDINSLILSYNEDAIPDDAVSGIYPEVSIKLAGKRIKHNFMGDEGMWSENLYSRFGL